MKKILESWKNIIKEYEVPTVLKERLLKPYFLNVKLASPVLDIGCGTGYFTEILSQRGLEMTGFDQNAVNIQSKVKYLQGDASNLPFKDKSFSSVLLINVLSCVDDPEARMSLLKEAKRVKKENEKIYVINTSEKLFSKPTNSDLLKFVSLGPKKIKITVKKTDNKMIEFEDYIITQKDMEEYTLEIGLKLVETKEFIDLEMKTPIYTLYVLE